MIVAVGSPGQWPSSMPLPPDVVLTDLVLASTEHRDLAAELWGPFVMYVSFKSDRGIWSRLRTSFLGIPVRVSIADPAVRRAVSTAISNCDSPRLRVQTA